MGQYPWRRQATLIIIAAWKPFVNAFWQKNRKICPQNPSADTLTIWHGAGILAKYLHTPVCWNWQTRRTQNPLVVTPYGFDPHHRHQSYLSGFYRLGIFCLADIFFPCLPSCLPLLPKIGLKFSQNGRQPGWKSVWKLWNFAFFPPSSAPLRGTFFAHFFVRASA